ncbi:MAG: ABC transporter ATP-binding protein [Rhodospirillales bacterium]
MTAPGLAVEGLTVRDGAGFALVDGISFTLPASGALTIIGETGSGKSLVAQAIFGLLPKHFIASGWLKPRNRRSVSFADRPGLQSLWHAWSMLLPQEPGAALDPTMRLGRQLAEIVRGNLRSVAAALSGVDLAAQTVRLYPFELSGGMSQRALVAAAMLTDAPVLVADEPTKGLDRARIGQTLELLRALIARGRGLITITHDLDVAEGLPGTVAVMKDGLIVEQGDSEQVLNRPSDPYTRAWLAADPRRWATRAPGPSSAEPVLAARDLAFGWPGGELLFHDLGIDIKRGATTAVTGPSGCGKSTLAGVLLGLRPPVHGQVSWAGIDPYADRRAARLKRRRYQKLHQDPSTAFIPHRTIGAQLAHLTEVVPGLDLLRLLPPLLDRMRLKPVLLARYPGEVSGGEAQRLALLRLLLLEPDVIVADEPTSRLDPIVQRDVIDLLRDCVERDGLALVLISHDAALVDTVATDTITLGA